MNVGLLTEIQKQTLIGERYNNDSYFNPVQDKDGNWIISIEEINFCTNVDYLWVKDLPIIEWTGHYKTPSLIENNIIQ